MTDFDSLTPKTLKMVFLKYFKHIDAPTLTHAFFSISKEEYISILKNAGEENYIPDAECAFIFQILIKNLNIYFQIFLFAFYSLIDELHLNPILATPLGSLIDKLTLKNNIIDEFIYKKITEYVINDIDPPDLFDYVNSMIEDCSLLNLESPPCY